MGGWACVPSALSLPANLAIELWIEARCAICTEARGLRRAARVRREYITGGVGGGCGAVLCCAAGGRKFGGVASFVCLVSSPVQCDQIYVRL
jgi:hypothetical protein